MIVQSFWVKEMNEQKPDFKYRWEEEHLLNNIRQTGLSFMCGAQHQNKHWDVHIQQKLQKVEELKTKKKKKKKIVWCHSRQKPNLKVKLL